MKRTRFLLGAVSGLTLAAGTHNVFGKALAAAPLPGLPGSADRVLVVINLQGGNDGLNTVVPYASPQYYRYRPSLGIGPNDVLRLSDQVGLNPALRSLKSMYDKGQVAIVQGAGYPQPDHSHFRSTEIWQTAAPERYERTGWLGRFLDEANLPRENLFNAVAVAPVLPEALISNTVDVPAIGDVRGYTLASDRAGAAAALAFRSVVNDRALPFSSPYLGTVAEIEDHAQRGSQELPKLVAGYTTEASYPATQIGRSLALAAQIIGSRLSTRVLYVQHGSFDTHAAQRGTQDRLLSELSDALSAFSADLAAHGNDQRVLAMTFSEFGRRAQENASRGTDHGEAGPMFLVGGGVKGGLYGAHPSLDVLDRGDVTFTTDFRSVYATVIERWLGRPSAPVLAGTFPLLGAVG